jgi:hypothetical protein
MAEKWSMTKDELRTWAFLGVTVVAYAIYVVVVLLRANADDVSLPEVSYVAPMLWSIGGAIIAAIVLEVIGVIVVPSARAEGDERDREINRFGEYTGQSLVVIGGIVALALTLAEVDYFWIANALYLAFVLSGIVSCLAKLAAYRKGFQPW